MDSWCQRRRLSRGALLSIPQVWDLGRLWYAGRMERGWSGRSAAAAHVIFEEVGLTGPFWRLDG